MLQEGEASSYPGRQRRRSSWWQNIIQMISFTRPWPEQGADDEDSSGTDSETEQDGDEDYLPELHDEVNGLSGPGLLWEHDLNQWTCPLHMNHHVFIEVWRSPPRLAVRYIMVVVVITSTQSTQLSPSSVESN